MKSLRITLTLLTGLTAAGAAHAEIPLGTFAGSTVGFEGLTQWDAYSFDNDRVDLTGNASDDDFEQGPRRIELSLKGKAERLDWVVAYDAHAQRALDVNLKFKLSFGSITIGQFKQFNGLEELSSLRSNDFVSRHTAGNLFAVGRRLGVGWGIENARFGAQASSFTRELTDGFNRGRGYSARGWWSPINDGGRVLHFGGSWVAADTTGDRSRLRVRPNADFSAVRLLDAGAFANTNAQETLGLEAMWIDGPLRVQAEAFQSTIDRYPVSGAPNLSNDFGARAWSVQALWNLGGIGSGYRGGVPTTSISDGQLWQLGVRWDGADLNDGFVRGGRGDAITLGVNAYLGKHMKVAGNYVIARTERRFAANSPLISDDPRIAELRLQFHW